MAAEVGGRDKEVAVNAGSPALGLAHGRVGPHDDVGVEAVVAAVEPHVGVKAVIHEAVVPSVAAVALAQLEAAREHQVVEDVVIAGAVVEADVPAVVAAPAAVADDAGLYGVEEGEEDQPVPGLRGANQSLVRRASTLPGLLSTQPKQRASSTTVL